MIFLILICVLAISEIQSLNANHSHYFPVRRKTDYKVNITIYEDDVEMVIADNFTVTSNKFSKIYRKKPQKASRTKNLVNEYDESNTMSLQNITTVISTPKVTTPKPSQEQSHAADLKEREERTNELLIRNETILQIRQIIQIWLFTYIIIAVPIWCTIGRCCWCLCCRRFKAQETIREAKLYSTWNAPGVLRNRSGDVFYEPSEAEKEAHEALVHVMRTL